MPLEISLHKNISGEFKTISKSDSEKSSLKYDAEKSLNILKSHAQKVGNKPPDAPQ